MSNIVPSTFNTPYLTLSQAYSLFVPLNTIATRISSAVASAFTFFTQPFNSSSTGTFGNAASLTASSALETFQLGSRTRGIAGPHGIQTSTGHAANDMSLFAGADLSTTACYLQSAQQGVGNSALCLNFQGGQVRTKFNVLDDGSAGSSTFAGTMNLSSALITSTGILDDGAGNMTIAGRMKPGGGVFFASANSIFMDPTLGNINFGSTATGGSVFSVVTTGGSKAFFISNRLTTGGSLVATLNNILDDGAGYQNLIGTLNCTDSTLTAISVNNPNAYTPHNVCANGLYVMKTLGNSASAVNIIFDSATNRGVIACSTYNVGYLPLALNPNGGTVVTNKNILDDGAGNTSIVSATITNGAALGQDMTFNSATRRSIYPAGALVGSGNVSIQLRGSAGGTVQLNYDTSGPVITGRNTLDDGTGSAIFAGQLGVGVAGTTLGSIAFKTAANTNTVSLQAPATGVGASYTVSLPINASSTVSGYPCSVICNTFNQMLFAPQYTLATISISSAVIISMFATPFTVITAAGAGTAIIVHQCELAYNYSGTAFTAGGSIFLQYGPAAAAGGIRCSGTLGNATGVAQNTVSIASPAAPTMTGRTAISQTAVTISNDTAAYATGNGNFLLNIWFSYITL